MATAAVTHVFINGTAADAIEVNTNFDDLVDFLNDEVVHRDGSKAMTGNLDAGGFKVTNLAAGASAADGVRFDQIVEKTLIDAKGDLLVGSAADTVVKVAAGSDGQVLEARASESGGVRWVANAPAGAATVKFKAADETLSASQNVLQDDDDLFFPIGATEKWGFEITFQRFAATTNDDMGVAFSFPAGATLWWSAHQFQDTNGAAFTSQIVSGTSEVTTLNCPASPGMGMTIRGYVEGGGTAGDVKMRWRNTTAARNVTVGKGSSLIAYKLA